MAKTSLTGAPEVVATSVVAKQGENLTLKTSERPRPAKVVDSQKIGFQKLEGSKFEKFAKVENGVEVVDLTDQDLNELKQFKASPSRVYKLSTGDLKVLASYCEVGTDGQRFSGSKSFNDIEFNGCRYERLTGDKIGEIIGRHVDGSRKKSNAERLFILLSKAEENAQKLQNKSFQEHWKAVKEDLKDIIKSEKAAREKAEAEAKAEAKRQSETDKTVETLRKQGMSEDFIQMYLSQRK